MSTSPESNPAGGASEQTFPSTTSEWKWAKIRKRPQGTSGVRAKRGRWHGLVTWPRARPLTIKVAYRAGPESWWLVSARGRHGVFPGSTAIEDVMAAVCNEVNGPAYSVTARPTV